MTLRELTEEFLLYLSVVRGLSDNTVKGYGNDLGQMMDFLTPELDIKTITHLTFVMSVILIAAALATSIIKRSTTVNIASSLKVDPSLPHQ